MTDRLISGASPVSSALSTMTGVVAGGKNNKTQSSNLEKTSIGNGEGSGQLFEDFLLEMEDEIELPRISLFHSVMSDDGFLTAQIDVNKGTVLEDAHLGQVESSQAADSDEELESIHPNSSLDSSLDSGIEEPLASMSLSQPAFASDSQPKLDIAKTRQTLNEFNPQIDERALPTSKQNAGASTFYTPLADSSGQQDEQPLQNFRVPPSFESPPKNGSAQHQGSGNSLPQDGKILPGSLLFYSQASDGFTKPQYSLELASFSLAEKTLSAVDAAQVAKPLVSPASSSSEAAQTFAHTGISITADSSSELSSSSTRSTESSRSFSINAPVASLEWNSQLSNKVRWMSTANLATAELKLHPAELGTVEIRITTEDDQTKVSFVASSTAAKEAIESSLPRLRDLLNSDGLQLAQSDVSQKDLKKQHSDMEPQTEDDVNEIDGMAETNTTIVRRSDPNRIDHYV